MSEIMEHLGNFGFAWGGLFINPSPLSVKVRQKRKLVELHPIGAIGSDIQDLGSEAKVITITGYLIKTEEWTTPSSEFFGTQLRLLPHLSTIQIFLAQAHLKTPLVLVVGDDVYMGLTMFRDIKYEPQSGNPHFMKYTMTFMEWRGMGYPY